VRLDVIGDASVQDAVGKVIDRAGRIDVLFNNAGIVGRSAVTEQVPLDLMREVMKTNFFGAVRVTQAVLPQMRDLGDGCIVNVSSVNGRVALAAGGH
jgi:NAD(P)-dependent dehydrogenase (short-subunit alcohol dehydrogenase family)